MKKIIIALVVVLATFASCVKDGKRISTSGSVDDFNVVFLFEADSVRVYRFYDGGRAVYFTKGGDKIGYTERRLNGKTTEGYDVDVVTYGNHWRTNMVDE